MTSSGELALQLQDQGWRGLLPVLGHDAKPHIRLAPEKAAEVASGRGKAPGRWAGTGWSLLSDWRAYRDDAEMVETWAQWPGVNVGLRACHAAPWVTFLDVDVLHHEASAEIQGMLRRRLHNGEFLPRIGNWPKFLIPVQTTEPVRKARSIVVDIGGERHMVELLGQGQQAVVAGIHPKTGRPYLWPEGGLEETEPAKLPLLTPAELHEILDACSKILLRYGPAVGRKGRTVRAELGAVPKPLGELRARNPALSRAAAEYVVNADWARDDWVAWSYALRGAFGDEGQALWLRFAAQSSKATNPATAAKVWRDATQAERDGHLRSGAATILAVAREEGFTPPPIPGLPAYFDGGQQAPGLAHSELEEAVRRWTTEALAYDGKSEPPRDAIAGGVGLGKTDVTLRALADMAQGKTIFYFTPTTKLGDEVVANAKELGLEAVLVRGREANKADPGRWPALCAKDDVATTLAHFGRPVWSSLCRKVDEFGNVTTCEFFVGCPYIAQFNDLDGKLIVLSHEWLTLPKPLLPEPAAVVIDERFHPSLIRTIDLPLGRVTAQRLSTPGVSDTLVADLTHDAAVAMTALEAGQTMAEAGLTPDRLRQMARVEATLADPPVIWPGLPYAEQQRRAAQLKEIEAFRLAKLWHTLAKDHDRHTQRVVIARGIERWGELQDRVFVHSTAKLKIAKHVPVLVLDADHDPLIAAATLPTSRRTAILPMLNAKVSQARDTACSKRKLLGQPDDPASLIAAARRRREILDLARHRAAQGRRVLIGTYKSAAALLKTLLAEQPDDRIEIASFGAIRGLDGWKDFEVVIVAGREQPRPLQVENMARSLFGANPERLLLTGGYVKQARGHLMKDGTRTAVEVWVHPDLRVQALVEQIREREIEQFAGRLRLVHRTTPAEIILLSNLPTALAVDRLVTWDAIMPSKLEHAIIAGRGVLPLSYSELARAHPTLWATGEDARWWWRRKGGGFPIMNLYWKPSTLSTATRVTYRRPGQTRGSPQQALVPGDVRSAEAAVAALALLLGEVMDVRIVEVLQAPGTTPKRPADHGAEMELGRGARRTSARPR